MKLLGTNGIFQRKLLSLKASHYCITFDFMFRPKDPKCLGYLKIQDKLKLQAEESHLSMRKLTNLVEIRLDLLITLINILVHMKKK